MIFGADMFPIKSQPSEPTCCHSANGKPLSKHEADTNVLIGGGMGEKVEGEKKLHQYHSKSVTLCLNTSCT